VQLVIEPLPRAALLRDLQMNQVEDREDEGDGARRRGVEARAVEDARPASCENEREPDGLRRMKERQPTLEPLERWKAADHLSPHASESQDVSSPAGLQPAGVEQDLRLARVAGRDSLTLQRRASASPEPPR
jgi:hypothetical protein